MIYTYLFPEHYNSLRGKRVGPLLYCISVVGPPRVMVKYVHIISQARREEKKNKRKGIRVAINVPRIGGQIKKSSHLKGGGVLCG